MRRACRPARTRSAGRTSGSRGPLRPAFHGSGRRRAGPSEGSRGCVARGRSTPPFLFLLYVTALAATTLLVVLVVAAEGPRRRELAELVTDHRLGDEHRDVLAAVVHGDRVAEHGRHDHRAARPGLDHVLGVGLVLRRHLAEQVVIDERTLFETARHCCRSLLALLADVAAANDELVTGKVALARPAFLLAPRADRVTSTGRLALATTVRVVDRVHGDTTDGRADALPAHAAGLAPVDVGLLGVADLADRGAAAHVDVADLAGGQTQLGVWAVLRHEAHRGSGGTRHLGAAARLQLDRVDDGTDRDVLQRQVVARLDVCAWTGFDDIALAQLVRRDDVALRAVHEMQERDARRAVRVVLDVRDLGVDAVFVIALEVDDAVLALVTSTDVAGRDAAGGVSSPPLRGGAVRRTFPRGGGGFCQRRARPNPPTTGRGGWIVDRDW